MFSEDGSENAVFVEDHSVPGLGSIEHHLLISNADVIAELQARWKDDPEFPCCSCERLHQRKQVSGVDFTRDDKYHTDIWMWLRAYLMVWTKMTYQRRHSHVPVIHYTFIGPKQFHQS